jgi:hypothetical protein
VYIKSGILGKYKYIQLLLVPDPSYFTRSILPGSDHILTKLIQAGDETLWSGTHKLINSV